MKNRDKAIVSLFLAGLVFGLVVLFNNRIGKLEDDFQKLVGIQHEQLKLQESMLDLIAPIQLTDPAEKVSNIPTPLEDSLMN